MGVLERSPQPKKKSTPTSTPPPSSEPSPAPPSPASADVAEQIAALTAKLEGLREAGEADRATINALRDELAALKAKPAADPARQTKPAGRTVRDFFKVGGTD